MFLSSQCLLFYLTGQPLDTTRPINHAAFNIIASIVYGSRFEYSNPQLKGIVDRVHENMRILGTAQIQVRITKLAIGHKM